MIVTKEPIFGRTKPNSFVISTAGLAEHCSFICLLPRATVIAELEYGPASSLGHLGDFTQHPNVPRVLERCDLQGLTFNMMETSFFVGRVTIVPARKSRFGAIRCKIFEAMHRNALAATEFFRIPPNRVIELGGQVEI
jgi:hypothetical protein